MELVKPILHQTLGRNYADRNKQIVHASDLTNPDFCSREHALHKLHGITSSEQFIATATKITWEYGRFIEHQFRNVWLRDLVIGNWYCKECRYNCNDFTLLSNEDAWCTCNCSNYWEYVEPAFTFPNTTFTGSPDCFLQIDMSVDKLNIPIEIKTIDKDRFALLKCPEPEHIKRCQLYLYLIANSNHPAKDIIETDGMQILYFSKSFGLKDAKVKKYNPADRDFSPIKEYTIARDDAAIDDVIFKLYQHYGLERLNILPDRICENAECARAQKCGVRKQCFKE